VKFKLLPSAIRDHDEYLNKSCAQFDSAGPGVQESG
jgi:hypothetical protein